MPRVAKPKPPTKTQRAAELGVKINEHLKRIEGNETINYSRRFVDGKWVRDPNGTRPYYMAGASNDGHRVWVRYVSYQGGYHLTVEEAEVYLAWLDAGNVGTHHDAHGRWTGKHKGY